MDLDVHLDRGDSFRCTGHLEIHISEEVLKSLNVCEQNEIVIRLACHQAAGDTCNHLLDGNTCCHQGHTGCTGRCHGRRTVGLKGLGYGTDCVREFLLAGQHGNQSSLCQCAVADLTSSGAS